jgi:hypothetical protein
MLSRAVLVILWLVVLWRVPTLWHDRWKRAPWIALFALAVALTVDVPSVLRWIDRSSGIADLATLVRHLSGVAASAAVLDWVAVLASARGPVRLRAHHGLAAAAMAAMIVLFALMRRPESLNFTAIAAGGLAFAYLQVFYAYLGGAMGVGAVLFWRVQRLSPRGTVRWGFWLLATGNTCGFCYAACQTGYVAARVLGWVSGASAIVWVGRTSDLQDLAILLILGGLCVPAFGVPWEACRDLAALRSLRSLWRDLVTAVPDITAGELNYSAGGPARSPHIRLIRRAAEIRDAALALRCVVSPALVAEARQRLIVLGLEGIELDAAAEACWFGLAVRAVGADGGGAGRPAAGAAHVLPGGETLAEEVRWLRRIARASRTECVRAVTAQLADGHPTGTT